MVEATALTKDPRSACVELQNAEAILPWEVIDEITTEMLENFKSAQA